MRKRLLIYLLKWYREQLMNHYSELKVEAMKRDSAFGAGTKEYNDAWFDQKRKEADADSAIAIADCFLKFVQEKEIKPNRESITGVLFLFFVTASAVLLLYLQYC